MYSKLLNILLLLFSVCSLVSQAEQAKAKESNKLVDVTSRIFNVVLDLKYATSDNFTKKLVYPSDAKCYLIGFVAQALNEAAKEFDALGYRIKIWDGYRPLQAQYIFWNLVPDKRYVANPQKGSRHNRGCAVDMTLIDKDGNEIDMGTEFDDFSERAHRDYKDLPEKILANRYLLQTVMEKHGFVGLKTEWWHFDFRSWENYPILDIPFNELSEIL